MNINLNFMLLTPVPIELMAASFQALLLQLFCISEKESVGLSVNQIEANRKR